MEPGKYLTVHEGYFWQWEARDQVFAIPEGPTIGYGDFVFEALEKLSLQGLPPLGSFLLSVLATNARGQESLDNLIVSIKNNPAYTYSPEVEMAIAFLRSLTELPNRYKRNKERIILFQSIFQDCHNKLRLELSKQIINYFKRAKLSKEQIFKKAAFSLPTFRRDIKTLALLHKRFPDKEAIIKNIAGIPELKEGLLTSDQELPSTDPQDFIETLLEQPKTFHVAALVKRIWSGLNIPFHSNVPSQQPFGGVADITNKGEFDKLLISEFANDNTVFLSRLANNEALFFNREIPPADNNLQRLVLIDISLKNWGSIKTLAFASLLAMANHPKTDIEHLAFLVGNDFYPIDISNIDEIIAALQILDTSLHAAKGLGAFIAEQDLSNKEVIFIGNEETLAYPEFQKVLADHQSPINYWIHPTVDGEISVYKKLSKSKKYVQTIRLPLEQLWKRKGKIKPIVEQDLLDKDYPILFPENRNGYRYHFVPDDTTFIITKEKSILKRYQASGSHGQKGWKLYYRGLKYFPQVCTFGKNEKDDYFLFSYNTHLKKAFLINLAEEKKIQEISIDQKLYHHERKLFFDEKVFVLFNESESCEINTNGEIEKNKRDVKVIRGRYNIQKEKENERNLRPGPLRQILKNVNRICVNESGCLVFNRHALSLETNGTLRLRGAKSRISKVQAKAQALGDFVFDDGSSVQILREGMIVLRSSNVELPTVYIPSVLGHDLGVATNSEYAGHPYFFKNELHAIGLTGPIPNKLAAIKITKNIFAHLGLKDAHELVDNEGGVIFNYASSGVAAQFKSEMARIDVEAWSKKRGGEQQQIPLAVFYKKYIKAFIQQIELHAT